MMERLELSAEPEDAVMKPEDILTAVKLRRQIGESITGKEIKCYDEVDSTNNEAKRLGENGAPSGVLVTAEFQTAGKGRRGRFWVSQRGSGIWMSFLLRPKILPAGASMLTLTAALAVVKGIKESCGLATQIKWPNDIVSGGKKLCGILTEMSAEPEHIHYVVIGIGINAGQEEFPEELKKKATSLYLETGIGIDRSEVLAAVVHAMDEYYRIFLETGDLSRLKAEYEKHLVNLGQEVVVTAASGDDRGVCLGIDKTGELLLQMEDKTIKRIVSGEVSVRGIYGYV